MNRFVPVAAMCPTMMARDFAVPVIGVRSVISEQALGTKLNP
jgi:hypothetical protein